MAQNIKHEAGSLPSHIAIIMDGNGRWAKKRSLPRTAGHAAGAETFRRIATYCKKIGIKILTVYAFSTENWKRPREEVASIIGLLRKYLLEAKRDLEKEGIRINFIGDESVFEGALRELMGEVRQINSESEMVCNIAVNYGGRAEIVAAFNRLAQKGGPPFKEEDVAAELDTAGQPEPDLIIRTGGEMRLSNFLMWQSAYSELLFSDKLWPDFTEKDIDEAVREYAGRVRRFGGI